MNTTFANHDMQQARRAERARRLAELEAAYEAAVTTNTRSFHAQLESIANDHLLTDDNYTSNDQANLAPMAREGREDEMEGPTWFGLGEAPTTEERGRGYIYFRGFFDATGVCIRKNGLNVLLVAMMFASITGIAIAFVTPSAGEDGMSSSSTSMDTEADASSPSLLPDIGRAPPISRSDYLQSILVRSNVSPMAALNDNDTPQGKAFAWLQEDDAFAMYSDNDDERYRAETGMDWHHTIERQADLIRYALAVLFYATTSTSLLDSFDVETAVVEPVDERMWKRSDNWLSGSSICSWHGITCFGLFDEIGRILPGSSSSLSPIILENNNPILLSINLSSNNLAGSLPPELFTGLGSSLRLLDLSWNNLSSTIPSEIGHATGLHKIDLASNEHLTGTLPATMSLISHLQYLSLDGCTGLTGTVPQELKHLTRLQLAMYPPSISED